MKLLNREPTEEMIRAACIAQSVGEFDTYEAWSDSHTTGISEKVRRYVAKDYQAMYDAAPEIHINMEPVAWRYTTNGWHLWCVDAPPDDAYDEGTLQELYSAEQVAALQAENERLTAERDELLPYKKRIDGLRELLGFVQNGSDEVIRITQDDATMDFTISAGSSVPSRMLSYGRSLTEALDMAIAKYEGEKHD